MFVVLSFFNSAMLLISHLYLHSYCHRFGVFMYSPSFFSVFLTILLKSWSYIPNYSPHHGKVRIFWEGHNIWKNLPRKIWRYWVVSNFKWKIFSNFVAFSEYPNFNIFGWNTNNRTLTDFELRLKIIVSDTFQETFKIMSKY